MAKQQVTNVTNNNDYRETTVTVNAGQFFLVVLCAGVAGFLIIAPFVLSTAVSVVLYALAAGVALLSAAGAVSLVLCVWAEIEVKRLASRPPNVTISAPQDNRTVIVIQRSDGAQWIEPLPGETRNEYLKRLSIEAHNDCNYSERR